MVGCVMPPTAPWLPACLPCRLQTTASTSMLTYDSVSDGIEALTGPDPDAGFFGLTQVLQAHAASNCDVVVVGDPLNIAFVELAYGKAYDNKPLGQLVDLLVASARESGLVGQWMRQFHGRRIAASSCPVSQWWC